MSKPRSDLDPVRRQLLDLVQERGASLAAASRAVGRNHAYLQQFITRGTPRRLPEDVRYALANFLRVDESTLRPLGDRFAAQTGIASREDSDKLASFTARLAVARAESPHTVPSAFAAAAGINRWRYSELEEGDDEPTLDELDRIARTSGKALDWLIRGCRRRPPAEPIVPPQPMDPRYAPDRPPSRPERSTTDSC